MSVESRRGGAQRGHERPREQSPDRSPSDQIRPAQGGRTGAEASRRPAMDKMTSLLGPVVAEVGFDLEEVTVTPAGRRRLVRVVVDGDEGVSLDDVAVVSRAVSDALDESDIMGTAPYVLEVTSPGIDRPLTEPRHWRRAAGRLVRAALSTGGGDIEGRVITADDEAVVFDIDGEQRRFELQTLGRGRVQVEFRRPGDAPGADDDVDVEPDED